MHCRAGDSPSFKRERNGASGAEAPVCLCASLRPFAPSQLSSAPLPVGAARPAVEAEELPSPLHCDTLGRG